MTIADRISEMMDMLPPAAGRSGWPWSLDGADLPDGDVRVGELPRITIITSSFNRADFIEETLRGVLLQGYPNLEYIVVDGASTDGTLDILERYRPWISKIISEPDTGECNAVNKGFRICTGDIVTFNSSDDVYMPGVLHEVARLYTIHPDAGAFAGGFYRMNEHSAPISDPVPAAYPFSGPQDLSTCHGGEWRLHQQALFYRRSALVRAGMYLREDLRYTGDRELLYRVCLHAPVAITSMVFAGYRVHEASLTTGSATRERADREFHALQAWYVLHREPSTARRVLARRLHAKMLVNRGRFDDRPLSALWKLLVAFLRHPSVIRSHSFHQGCKRVFIRGNR